MNLVIAPRPSVSLNSGSRRERTRTIIFVAPPGSVPERLKQAVETEFLWTVVEEVGHVDEAVRIFPSTVSLLLVHSKLIADAERIADDLFRFHPLAMTAVLDDGDEMDGTGIFASKLVRGVLPIHSRLDLSLSIMSLLLRGIEYFPRALFSAVLDKPAEPPPAAEPTGEPVVPAHLRVLTRREIQVLELVERGLQNKSIARDLNLSGHTVKIHLHNIITKLGASNRTEAAAFYRAGHAGRVFH
jgi:DNA-binding NarL/FixJ family response regulator